MGSSREVPALFSIGINSGGMSAANRPIHEALGDFMRTVVRERTAFANNGLRVNLVFNVPGPMFQPDFVGVHTSDFDRKNSHLLVLAAVPPELASDEVPNYLVGVLKTVGREVHAHAARKRIAESLDDFDAVIGRLVALLGLAPKGIRRE
jgi:hypothetical protein